MSIKSFKKINTSLRELDKVQSNISDYVQPLTNNPMLDGLILTEVDVSTSSTIVNHGLGRDIRGWFIVNKDSNINVWAVSSEQSFPGTQLVLTASGTGIVSIYVF